MDKWLRLLSNYEKNYQQLATNNRKAIEEYNAKMLSALTLLGGVLMLLEVYPMSSTKFA